MLSIGKLFCTLLAAALTCAQVQAQFAFEVYDGTFSQLPNFSTLTPQDTGSSYLIDVSVTSQTQTFALVFTNTLQISTAATYEFSATSDDGSRVYVGGNLVVDNDGLHGAVQQTGSVFLNPGSYSFRVEYFENSGAQSLAVGYRTGTGDFQPIPPDGLLRITSAAELGQWSPVINWPHIAISAANLPDGRVLSWSSTETNAFPSGGPEFTHASVFDPQTLSFTNVDNNFHDMFCAGVSSLENGVILASGGNPDDRRTTSFDPATLSWTARSDMIDKRWYGANITMPNGHVFSTFAKSAGNRSEMYNPAADTWTATPNANMQTLVNEQNAINSASNPAGAFSQEWWAHIAVAPQGDVVQGGPTPTWHRFDPAGGAANVSLGQPIGDQARMYGNAVTYDAGKVMLIGGSDRRDNPPTSVNNAYLVDLNGPSPVITSASPMHYPRALSNSVTLPNGEVIVIGGNTVAKIFSDTASVLPAEIYTPATDSWRVVAGLSVPRNYHSTALLLKDATVLSAGGGACGNCSANHLDGQIYSPPYLFNPDGSPATRPVISALPLQVEAGEQATVTASAGTTGFAMVRLSSTTHHLNTDQRFLPVPSVDNGDGSYTLNFNANPNVLIVGNYWLFALNANGTPSLGKTIQVIRNDNTIPAVPSIYDYVSDLPWLSESNGWGPAERDASNGEEAGGDGNTLALNGVTYAKGIGVHANSEISVDLAGGYQLFEADIGLDDERNGLCGSVSFEVDVDGSNQFASAVFSDTTATQSIAVPVNGANTLTLKVLDGGDGLCGDHADWANARLTSASGPPGYRFYRFKPLKLRNDAIATSIQLAELAFFDDGTRLAASNAFNPGGNNPATHAPAMADDNLVATKWMDYNKGSLVYDFGANTVLNSYSFTTADSAAESDPVRWMLEASKDGDSWVLIDDRSAADYPTPPARSTAIAPINIVLPGVIVELPEAPRNSSTLLVRRDNGSDRIWNVNPDNNSVTVSSDQGSVVAEIAVGSKPWALASRPGTSDILVSNKGDNSISVINTDTLAVSQTINLAHGVQPHGIVFNSTGTEYFLVLEAAAILERRDANSHTVTGSVTLSGAPRHVSASFDDSRIFVSNFITPPLAGEHTAAVNTASGTAQVFAIDPVTMALANTIELTHDNRSLSESQGPGMPNYLGAAVVSFNDQYAYVPSKKDNIDSGPMRGKIGMTFDSTVRANTSRISLATETEDPTLRIDHDNSSVATHAALTGNNRYLLVTLETSRELAVYDTKNGFQLMRLPTGLAPQSVALSTDGRTAYVHNFMSRSISRFDLTQMLETDLPATSVLPAIDTTAGETLPADVLLGKQLFYDAADDRLSLDNYMSCAACHKEGKHDGRTWDLSGMGEGLRRTITLEGRGAGHGRQHWTGNFDEVQDFENQIRALNFGTGLMDQQDFDATADTLGPPKAGLSSDLDALVAYVNSLTSVPASPHRASAAAMSSAAQNGKALFANKGCNSCHSAVVTTDSAAAQLHDVGTIDSDSGQRLGSTLTGFDTPAIVGAWTKPPYLHDGSAHTLQDAISAHTSLPALSASELDELAAFAQQAQPQDTADIVDSDGDGVMDFEDPAAQNPCVPSAFVAVCAQDSDGDGSSDFSETETADTDGDGIPDYLESSTADSDGDTYADQLDAGNDNACVPEMHFCAQNVPLMRWPHAIVLGIALMAISLATRRRRQVI